MNDVDLQLLLRSTRASRDHAIPPPAFTASWRLAVATSESRRALGPSWLERLMPLAAAFAIAAVALVAWQFADNSSSAGARTDAADLRLARELAPTRQWPSTTDSLLRRYDYAPPFDIVIPEIENPFEESFL